jgi:rare lipoprotein A
MVLALRRLARYLPIQVEMRWMIAFLLGITPLACFSAEFGFASWYGYPFHGRVAADGSVYDMEQITAAHKTLPLGSWVRVTNLKNGKVVDVRITDRGPFIDGRVIDLSRAAARAIDVLDPGTAPVRVEVLQAGLPVLMPSITATSTGPSITGMVLNEVTRANVEQMSSIAPIPARMPPSKTLEAKTLGAKTLAAETFAVQVGAYQDRGNAERMRLKMDGQTGSARLVARAGTPVIWRVVIGSYANFQQADQSASHLRSGGTSAVAIRVGE